MKKLINYLVILAIIPAFTMMGCKKEATETEFEKLTKYMAENNLDLPNVLDGWIIGGTALTVDPTDFSVADYHIFDLRAAADFDLGHIKDAQNVTLAGLVDAAEAVGKDKSFLLVCYTGQNAARGTGILKMLGYNAKTLKWGMSAWHEDFAGKWNSNATDYPSPNWVTTGTPSAVKEFADPTISTGEVTGEAILKARIDAILTEAWTASKVDVLAAPSNYFINNKWSLDSWDTYGHISGAYRIDEDLNLDALINLDPNAEMITYCYTGQTSSITNAWLDVLGYNGKSLTFGVNGISHTALVNGSVHAKAWKGAGSASELNYGYYDASGSLHNPK